MDKEPEEFQMLVHLFGRVSSPSWANYALQKTVDDNAEHFDEDTIQKVRRNFYVDDRHPHLLVIWVWFSIMSHLLINT